MMVCRSDKEDGYRVHPCVEINMRMNMGVVARLFYDRFVAPGSKGCFAVEYVPDNETLRAYLAEVLPNFDRERVYPTDIKKLISWYNLLVETGNTDFVEEEKPQKDADVENTAATDDSVNEKEEKPKTKKTTKKKAE